MVTLDLSRVDRKAQDPLELVSYWSLLVPLQATHASRYALLYLNSEIYIVHVIDCE